MEERTEYPVTIKEWLIVFLLLSIPLVNIIMLFVWSFGDGYSITKSNFAKASLLWMLLIMGLYFFLILIFGSMWAVFGNADTLTM